MAMHSPAVVETRLAEAFDTRTLQRNRRPLASVNPSRVWQRVYTAAIPALLPHTSNCRIVSVA